MQLGDDHLAHLKSKTPGGPTRSDLISADWLAGLPVLAPDGEPVGELAHVMLDMLRGNIAYAALSCESLLGSADRLVAVPWSALSFDAAHRRFFIQLGAERLRQAPQRDRAAWPLLADVQFAAEIEAYYGVATLPPV